MSRLGKLFAYASLVREQTGKSYLRQMVELYQLASGPHRLGVEEYYELAVFDDAHFPGPRKVDCIGWRASHAIDLKLNGQYWRATANDKVLNYALLQHYGFAMPNTVATYSPQQRRVGKELSLGTRLELEAYLTQAMRFPVFIKPIHGSYGRGTFLLKSYEAAGRYFIDAHGKQLALTDLMNACLTPQYSGMLFQDCLQPHADV